MECKLWICRILQLVCTMRLDIRLSLLLRNYREEWNMGAWEAENMAGEGAEVRVFQLLDRYQSPTGFGGRTSRGKSDAQPLLAGHQKSGNSSPGSGRRMSSKRGSSAGASKRPSTINRTSNPSKGSGTGLVERARGLNTASRRRADTNIRRTGGNIFDIFKGGHMDALDRSREHAMVNVTFDLLKLDGDELFRGSQQNYQQRPELVPVLLDLIFYEHRPLVSEALNLLVRHFEQKRVLQQSLQKVQILIKPNMVRMFGEFDQLLADINRLAARRRLFDNEIYQVMR